MAERTYPITGMNFLRMLDREEVRKDLGLGGKGIEELCGLCPLFFCAGIESGLKAALHSVRERSTMTADIFCKTNL